MENQNNRQKLNRSQFVPLAFIGGGLIILGLLIARALTNQSQSQNYSVVPVAVNFPAPELVLSDLNGNKVNIADYRQQIVMINNWATWCPPCKDEMPTLSKYYKAHSNQGFMLFGIDAGDLKNDVASFVDKYGISFPILIDPNTEALTAFRIDSLPSSYVIDHNGNVILAWMGPINREMLEKYVTPLLEQ